MMKRDMGTRDTQGKLPVVRRWAMLVGLGVSLAACSEGTLIRTAPPGATIYVNGNLIGLSPVSYRVPEERFSPHTSYRIERDGYEPVEGQLKTYTPPGRIIGGIFGLGVPFAFRGVTAFHKVHDVQLQPAAQGAVTRPVGRAPDAEGAVDAGMSSADAESKLRRLQNLYDRGLISDDEYRTTRSRIIRGL